MLQRVKYKMDIKYINRANANIEIEHPPAEEILNFLYYNPFGAKAILPLAKHKFITEWYGEIMDSSSSIDRIQPFIDSFNIDMSEAIKKVNEFKSFNDFFYRRLKSDARKISHGLISPGDGKILAFQNVSQVKCFYVKGRKFTLREFLNDDGLAEKYNNASMIILRLAPHDYHRYHFPFKGIPSKSKKIEGTYYSVSPIALKSHFTKVFHENKKEICTLTTEK